MIEDIPDMIEYDISIRNLSETEILFIDSAELIKIEKEKKSNEKKDKPKQRIKSIFKKQK